MHHWADKNFQKALAFFKNKDIDKAEELCLQTLKKEPNHGNTLHLLGVITWKHGKAHLAIELIEKAIAHQDEKRAISCCNLAMVYTHIKHIEKAAEWYKRAADLFHEKEERNEALNALLNGAYLLKEHGLLGEAKSFYERILELNPFHVDACNDFGVILLEEGKREEACQYFRKALQIDPGFREAQENLEKLTTCP